MTTTAHRFRKTAAALSLIGVLSTTACAPVASDASTTAASVTTSSASTTAADTATSSASTESTATSTTTEETIAATTAAAEDFMVTLSEEQREALVYAYDDEAKTTSWSNFPVTIVDRAGLNLAELTEEQQAAALEVLEGLLSDEGYHRVTGIMGGDEFLLENSSNEDPLNLGQYYIAFFGDPSDSTAWEVQFGGHHLGINATLDGTENAITFAPTHWGSQPAVYTDADGNEVQPLAGMYETAFAFYDSLSEDQKAQLYQGEEVGNLVCAPGGTCSYPTGTGIAGSELSDEQKQLLLEVVANWVGLADEETTTEALAKIEATLDETYVSWSGATVYDMTQGNGIYFQISGPDVYIEFSNQQSSTGSDVAGYTTAGWGHIHTIYRDPANDYANSVAQQEAAGPGGGTVPAQ